MKYEDCEATEMMHLNRDDKKVETTHRMLSADARSMEDVRSESVELVVTSPPYPMIEMWDECFGKMNPAITQRLEAQDGWGAFELMHQELDKVWKECFRVLKPGCIACVNIGDAVRTVAHSFQMFCNQARITMSMRRLGFFPLPDVLWRKQTNAPNKFMGSGMLPGGAYVTYEHEYILVFRKGERRAFRSEEERTNRRKSSFFWEERNQWFSDVWTDLKGTSQELGDEAARKRSASYPFELAYRLICMHSVYGDTVLDPFLGAGTTSIAAIAAGRNSLGIEIDEGLMPVIEKNIGLFHTYHDRALTRLSEHRQFMHNRIQAGAKTKHTNIFYNFPVVSAQETGIELYRPQRLVKKGDWLFIVDHEPAVYDVLYEAPLLTVDEIPLPLFSRKEPSR